MLKRPKWRPGDSQSRFLKIPAITAEQLWGGVTSRATFPYVMLPGNCVRVDEATSKKEIDACMELASLCVVYVRAA